jgi:hypothetical protein
VNRTVSRRIERLEARAALSTRTKVTHRILFIDPIEGLKSVMILDADGTREEPGTPEEKERVLADLEARRAARK